jgi:YVTN family beta-propeller protein
VGDAPRALGCDPENNKIYCADSGSNDVTVIDGRTDRAIEVIAVGHGPVDLVRGPVGNRVYVANRLSSTISVLRDSANVGVEEGRLSTAGRLPPTATIVRGVLEMPEATSRKPQASSVLLDISGRKALDLKPGANDVSRLATGVYFVLAEGSRVQGFRGSGQKVVIQR